MSGIEFHPEAESELLAGARHYEEQAQKLGLDFLAAVEASCERILQFPDIGRPFGNRLSAFSCRAFRTGSSTASKATAR